MIAPRASESTLKDMNKITLHQNHDKTLTIHIIIVMYFAIVWLPHAS